MKAILLVTWFIAGQPPSSYQTVFNSRDACEAARAQVFADAARLAQERYDVMKKIGASQSQAEYMMRDKVTTVSAVCAAQ